MSQPVPNVERWIYGSMIAPFRIGDKCKSRKSTSGEEVIKTKGMITTEYPKLGRGKHIRQK